MSGETADPARAEIPDSGADVGAALWLYPEQLTSLSLLGDDDLLATVRALLAWLIDGGWEPPQGRNAMRVYAGIVKKHANKVAEYRGTLEARRKAGKASGEARRKNKAKYVHMMNTCSTHDELPNLTKPNQTNCSLEGVCAARTHAPAREGESTHTPPPRENVGGETPLPDMEAMVAEARGMGITVEYVRWWRDWMEGVGWVTSAGHAVGGRNWRAVLASFWRNRNEAEVAEVNAHAADRARRGGAE